MNINIIANILNFNRFVSRNWNTKYYTQHICSLNSFFGRLSRQYYFSFNIESIRLFLTGVKFSKWSVLLKPQIEKQYKHFSTKNELFCYQFYMFSSFGNIYWHSYQVVILNKHFIVFRVVAIFNFSSIDMFEATLIRSTIYVQSTHPNILRGKRNAGNTKYTLFLEKVNVELWNLDKWRA